MDVRAYLYNSASPPDYVGTILDALDDHESADLIDVADGPDARREAMFALRESIRIGDNPDAIYDDGGTPDFAPGVLVTEDPTGRRGLHVGEEALDALADEGSD